jgi:hypothetical protein
VLQDTAIPMRDGTPLIADVYLPDGDGAHPCLLQRVPYDRRNPGILNGALDVARAVRRGYAVVHQDCRGRFASGGDFTPFLAEADDGEDTIAWILAQPWCAGGVGMFGRSYSGLLQWATAARGPAGLRAIAPMMSGADPGTGWFGGEGPFEWGFAVLWSIRHLAPDLLARGGWPVAPDALLGAVDDAAELMLERAGERRIDALAAVLPFLAEWTDPLRRPGAFAQLSARYAAPDRIGVPALIVAGWFDIFLRGCLRAFAAGGGPGAERGLIVGPWAHGGTNSGVFPERDFGIRAGADAVGVSDLQLDWFDRWLRDGAPPTLDGAGTVRWFHMGADEWRTGPTWPPESATHREWHLAAAPGGAVMGALSDGVPATARTVLRYDEDDPAATIGGGTFLPGMEVAANSGPRDQRELIGRPHTAAFASEPLDADLDAIGPVSCRLTLSTGVRGQLVVARLVEIDPDGTAMLVSDGAAHLAGAAGPPDPVAPAVDTDTATEAAIEAEAQLEIEADIEVEVEVELAPTSHRFARGNRIGLLIGSGSVPRYRRGISGAPPAGRSGAWRLIHGAATASVLRIRVCPA